MGKKEKVKEPEYIISPIGTKMPNYKVYVMSKTQKMLYSIIGFLLGAVVGFIFFGGLFKDESGAATGATMISNIVVCCLGGFIGVRMFLKYKIGSLQEKRLGELKIQFRDFLSALSNSMSGGMNVTDALSVAYEDLCIQYSDESYIAVEVLEMINGIHNNIPIEETLTNFGERSGVDDISNFGTVFNICYRTGGNMRTIIRRTFDIISEKMMINEEIETKITSNKMQLKVMMIIPIVITILLKTMSSDFAKSLSSVVGVVMTVIAVIFFVVAYVFGNKIMSIKE